MNFSAATEQDYHARSLMLDVAYACIVKRGLGARAAGDKYGEETARRALTVLLEATLESLNTHVDDAIVSCNLTTKPRTPTVADHRATREAHLAALESRFAFKRSNLPGWDSVKKTNEQANAVKHRLGITWRPGTTTPLAIEDVVDLEEKELLLRMDEVHKWVLALGGASGFRERSSNDR